MQVHTLEVPNPFFEGRNRVYVIPSDPVTLIDTGVATQRGMEALVAGLAAQGLAIRDVGRVILTHKHIDHIGNAWRIQQETGAEILIHAGEMHAVSDVDPDSRRFSELVQERLRGWGAPPEALPQAGSTSRITWEIQAATPTGLVDGQRIDLGGSELEVIHTPGHTLGSICLKYGRLLLSGDHVLPGISPNIGGGDMRQQGLLKHYLESLRRVVALAGEIDQVLPGHGDPFADLAGRCHELEAHHRQRLVRVLELLAAGGVETPFEIARGLFGDMRDFHVVLGCAEAEAHLEYLVDLGRAVGERGRYEAAK